MNSGGKPGVGKKEDAHGSTAQRGHGPGGFVTPGEIVIPGFIGQGLAQKFLRILGVVAKGCAQVNFPMLSQAGTNFPVGGEPHLVAGVAEVWRGQGADESDHGSRMEVAEVAGRSMARTMVGEGRKILAPGDDFFGFRHGKKKIGAGLLERTEGHQFNKADRDLMFGGEVGEGAEFLLIEAAEQDAVQFDGLESGAEHGLKPLPELRPRASRNLPVTVGLDGIKAKVDGTDACLAQSIGARRDSGSIRGKGEGLDSRNCRES